MKLFGSTISKITKHKNRENVPEEVVLVHCNIVNNDYQQRLFQINNLLSY